MTSSSKRRLWPGSLRIPALFLVVLSVVWMWAVEPVWLEKTFHEVGPLSGDVLVVAHLTDLHMTSVGTIEHKVLDALTEEEPDLVVITGDLVDSEQIAGAQKFLAKLSAPLGVYAIPGNWEQWTNTNLEELAKGTETIVLRNTAVSISDRLWIIGVDESAPSSARDLLEGLPKEASLLILAHTPEALASLPAEIKSRALLALAGHTHGGQVRFPFAPPLWLPPGSGEFVAGHYDAEGMKIYVSRGIGMSLLPVRLLCRPELPFFTLRY